MESQLCPLAYILPVADFVLQPQNSIVAAETIGAKKQKIFTIQFFTKKVDHSLLASHYLSFLFL